MQNVAVTATDLAAFVWDAQHDVTSLFVEAELQQRRALSEHIHDVLVVMMALGFVSNGPPRAGCAPFARAWCTCAGCNPTCPASATVGKP
jgi:hypothetical protein